MNRRNPMRRSIIREWMALPAAQRQTHDQAVAFAVKVKDRVEGCVDPVRKIALWLMPRVDRG
jgi:hypothetical protein